MAPGQQEEEVVSSVQEALRYGADAAAVTVKFGHEREGDTIRQVSRLADACDRWGMPLLIEAQAWKGSGRSSDPGAIKPAARAAQETGADIVKISYTGKPESFRRVVEGCSAPLLILGGERCEKVEEVFRLVDQLLQAGARGIAMGRNIWQRKRVQTMVEAMVGLVHERWSVQQALSHLGAG